MSNVITNSIGDIPQAEFRENYSAPYTRHYECLPLLKDNFTGYFLVGMFEELFAKNPNGFLAFIEPQPDNPTYRKGQSLIENIRGVSAGDFKFEFSKIGVRYNSYRKFSQSEDKFNGKYYCSFYDAVRNQSFYLRNNAVMDDFIAPVADKLFTDEIYQLLERTPDEVEQIISKMFEDIEKIENGTYVFETEGDIIGTWRDLYNG